MWTIIKADSDSNKYSITPDKFNNLFENSIQELKQNLGITVDTPIDPSNNLRIDRL